jgi:siderophore synthetase component
MLPDVLLAPASAPAALAGPTIQPAHWHAATSAFLAKALAELLHERLIAPTPLAEHGEESEFELATDTPGVTYRFRAAARALDYWRVAPASIRRLAPGGETPLDALGFFRELHHQLGTSVFTLAHYLEEVNHTVYADAFIRAKGRPAATELAAADYQTIEHAMEGHPWLIINKGRLGFSVRDHRRYAPEADPTLRLLWLAVHRERATFLSLPGLDYAAHIAAELPAAELADFLAQLAGQGLNPDYYYLLPVHEWQWQHKLAVLLAADQAAGLVVYLGYGQEEHRPQQSIRTLYNAARPAACYVKTALSILNTGLIRGLAPDRLAVTPPITHWLLTLLEADTYLRRCGFGLLGEVATLAYRHPQFNQLEGAPYQYHELLGAIWRQPAAPLLAPGEQLCTMAALLYVDDAGESFVGACVARSGLSARAWLRTYLDAYFRPLLHCFYAHELFFVPHGENTLLVLTDGVPHRVILKDFAEEVQVTPAHYHRLPAHIRAALLELPEEDVPLFIFTDIFDGVFRYLSDIAHTFLAVPEAEFWALVAGVIHAYQAEFPALADRFARYDLFAPRFARFCLNRLRLLTYGYAEMAAPPAVPALHGELLNPVAAHRP